MVHAVGGDLPEALCSAAPSHVPSITCPALGAPRSDEEWACGDRDARAHSKYTSHAWTLRSNAHRRSESLFRFAKHGCARMQRGCNAGRAQQCRSHGSGRAAAPPAGTPTLSGQAQQNRKLANRLRLPAKQMFSRVSCSPCDRASHGIGA